MATANDSTNPRPIRSFVAARAAAAEATSKVSDGPKQASKNRLEGLEGLRGIGCLTIVFLHCTAHFSPTFLAATRLDIFGQWLTYFFVLSGFLLYLPYAKRFLSGKERPSTTTYLRHRVQRVFPAYLFIFIVSNFILRAVYIHNPLESVKDDLPGAFGGMPGTGMITDPLHLLAQFSLTQSLFPQTLQTGINPAWSLTTEWGFYLLLPLMCYLLFRFGRGTRQPLLVALIPAAILWVIGITFNTLTKVWQHAEGLSGLYAYWGPTGPAVLSRSFLSLADTFAWGYGRSSRLPGFHPGIRCAFPHNHRAVVPSRDDTRVLRPYHRGVHISAPLHPVGIRPRSRDLDPADHLRGQSRGALRSRPCH